MNLTKHVLSDRLPKLNQNTVAAVMRSLLDICYLAIAEIKYSQNILAKDYKNSIPFKDFLKEEYGEVAVKKLVNHAVRSLKNKEQTEYFSDL